MNPLSTVEGIVRQTGPSDFPTFVLDGLQAALGKAAGKRVIVYIEELGDE